MIPRLFYPLCFTFILLTKSSSVLSAEKSKSIFDMTLSELLNVEVITATKAPSSLKTVPATVYALSSKEIRQRGYHSLEDFLKDLPGIDFVDMQGTFPLIWAPRGSYGDENKRTLLLIDGVVENNILEGNVLGGPQYSLHNVDRIEFLWGPASALYGANALSGVINIITRKGRNINGSELEILSGSYNTQAVKFLAGQQTDNIEYSIAGSVYQTDGPVFKERNPAYSASYVDNAYSVTGRLSYKALNLGYHRYDRPMGYGQFFNSANEVFGLPLFGFANSEGQAIDNSLSPTEINGQPGTLWHSVTETAFVEWTQSVEQLNFKEKLYYRNSEIADDSYSYTLIDGDWAFIPFTHFSELAGVKFEVDYQISSSEQLILGLQYEIRNVETGYRRRETVQNTPLVFAISGERESTDYKNASSFGQYRFRPVAFQNTSITLGARYDDNNVYGSTFNPRLGLVYAEDSITIKTLMASAYRAPNSFDLFTETTVRIANPNLKPEKSNNFEFSFGYQATDDIFLESILYYNRLTDMIVSNVPIGDIDNDGAVETQNQNFGKADLYGVEFRNRFSIGQSAKLFFNLTIQEADSKQSQQQSPTETRVPNTAKYKSNLGIDWRLDESSSLYIAARYVGARSTAATNPRVEVNDYFVSDIAWNYSFSDRNNTSFNLKINNIFNNRYFDPAVRSADGLTFPTQYEYPGINVLLSFRLDF
ncbi:TonB-dependent receptor [Aliikangiella marina]|uniref:TonB-dependent receptor n=1 Tax=Aliikangiella marina TaxID=1712262 RepID=A0A545T2K4_9GAMM|nr:TonB-dependent receptor [Aliikangiella marina]TQV71451.1 TonB-dependent receptor [Aliikangiella marina]